MRERFTSQTVLVTGGAQGLGKAMADAFAREGAHVHVADTNGASLFATVDGINGTSPPAPAVAHVVDVSDPAAVTSWITEVAEYSGRVDVLVNNAGIIRDDRVERLSDADWDAVIATNLSGAFYAVRAVMPLMKARRYGRILSLSSMSWRGNFGQANYVAAKAGVVGMTRTIALEGARHGITANAIAPGLIETPMLASMNDRARDKLVSKIPVGHTGIPEDVAAVATFLASPQAGYITGVVLDVDGGIGIGSSLR